MTELLDDIRRDREAGTLGPWSHEQEIGPENQYGVASVGVWSEHKYQVALEGDEDDPDDAKWVCGIWGVIADTHRTDARRIARVPDMEARILSDADRITALEALVAALRRRERDARDRALVDALWTIGTSVEWRVEDRWSEGYDCALEDIRKAISALRTTAPTGDGEAVREAAKPSQYYCESCKRLVWGGDHVCPSKSALRALADKGSQND